MSKMNSAGRLTPLLSTSSKYALGFTSTPGWVSGARRSVFQFSPLCNGQSGRARSQSCSQLRAIRLSRASAPAHVLQVDSDLDGLLLLLLAFFTLLAFFSLVAFLTLLSLFVLVGFFVFVCRIFLLFRRFFFVALRLHKRGIALLEDRRINTP